MSKRNKRGTEGGGASWMETYSDMVTLLLTFFVMLYAMSTMDAQKYATIVESLTKQMNPQAYEQIISSGQTEKDGADGTVENVEKADLDQLYNTLTHYVDENNLNNQVEVSKSQEYVFIRFSDSVTFRGYSDILEQSGKDILDVLADGLALVDEYVEEVIIAGHTAKVEYDNTDIDRSLSTDRANVVLRYLESKNVIDPSKYLAIGYGLYSPIADNSTPEGRAKNRRVEIYISRAGYPLSYTKKIHDTINKDEKSDTIRNTDKSDDDIEYQKNTYISN